MSVQFVSLLSDVCGPSKSFVQVEPKVTNGFRGLDGDVIQEYSKTGTAAEFERQMNAFTPDKLYHPPRTPLGNSVKMELQLFYGNDTV